MKTKKTFRIAFYDHKGQIIFTTKYQSPSVRGAKRKAQNLEPFTFTSCCITDLSSEWNKKLDELEFNV